MDTKKIEVLINNKLDVLYLPKVDSTNSYLKHKDESNLLVLTHNQTAGKGRYGNSFIGYEGGLYFSLKLDISNENIESITIKTVLAVYDSIKLYNKNIAIKWLNDILFNNKKVVGILCENSYLGSLYDYTIIGIGINLYKPNDNLEIFNNIATFLFKTKICEEEFIATIINNLYAYLNDDDFIEKYKEIVKLKNKKLIYQNEIYVVDDIENDGRLKVYDLNNDVKYLDCTMQNVKIVLK